MYILVQSLMPTLLIKIKDNTGVKTDETSINGSMIGIDLYEM